MQEWRRSSVLAEACRRINSRSEFNKQWTVKLLAEACQRIVASHKFKRAYEIAGELTAKENMTDHSEKHGANVNRLGLELMERINQLFPGTFSELEMEFAGPLAFPGHDLGRSEPSRLIDGKFVDLHERDSARILNEMMKEEDIPAIYRSLVTFPVVNHRASGVLGRGALEPPVNVPPDQRALIEMRQRILAILVLADKTIGDAERVHWKNALWLIILSTLRISNFWFDRMASENQGRLDDRNNFANFAIKKADVIVDKDDRATAEHKGSITLQIQLDDRVCTMEQILRVKWFSEAFHCCGKASQALGFNFRIRATSKSSGREALWFWSADVDGWAKYAPIVVPGH